MRSSDQGRRLGVTLALATLLCASATAQQPDRDRRALMQLQQQLQKVQQEKAALQQQKDQEIERVRAESAAAAAQAQANKPEARRPARSKEGSRALADARAALSARDAELTRLRADLASRDAALAQLQQKAESDRKSLEDERARLQVQVRASTQRADTCQAKHAQALGVGQELFERLQTRETRSCEPFTGLWRVKVEEQLQTLQDRLFEARLDAPLSAASAAPR